MISSAEKAESPEEGAEEKKEPAYLEEKNVILEAMKKAGEPLNAGKIAELTGLDRKVVDKAMAAMKKDGLL